MSTDPQTLVPVQPAPLSEVAAQIIPLEHHEKFHSLTIDEQVRVSQLLKYFAEIESAPEGVVATIRRIALENAEHGFSFGNLKTLFYAWKGAKRDWRVCVRNYGNTTALPPEFIEEVRRRSEQNARSTRQAFLEIRAEWAAGKEIPGYGTWRQWYLIEFPERELPPYFNGTYPKGWSPSNLYTKQSSKAERVMKRRGFAAAKRYLPHVMRDTSGLRFLELITIDDFETDIMVLARHPVTQKPEICTCTGLLALDVATRTFVGFGLKPRFKGDDGQRIAITRSDVQQLLYSVFSEHGMPAEYRPTILCENAAAAISGDFELALETLLGVQVARTGLLADKTLRNGFVQSGGKPWEKGWLESSINLVHNAAGALAGQKGASYQVKPGDLEAKVAYAEKLISIDGLAPEVAARLQTPFLPFEQALDGYTAILRRLEQRTKHACQGFREVFEYRLPDGSAIVDEAALTALALTREQLQLCTPVGRMESPAERKARITAGQQFVKISDATLALLLLTPKKCELRNHRVCFAHGAERYVFADADSPVMALAEGTELLGYFDGGKSDVLHCTLTDGRYVGSVKRRGAVDIRDRDALGREAGEITRLITKCVLNPLRERHAGEDLALAAADAHNLKLLRAAGVPDAQIPARLLPPAANAASAHNAQLPPSSAASSSNPTQASGAAAIISKGVSAKLGNNAPAKSAGEAYRRMLARQQLANGIALQAGTQAAETQTAKTLADADDLDAEALL